MSQVTLPAAGLPHTSEESMPEFVSDKVRPDVVAKMLSEYTRKLNRLVRKTHKLGELAHKAAGGVLARALVGPSAPPPDLSAVTEARDAKRLLTRLLPAATELARLASAQIEHARIRPYERVELMLRAAELEAALESATEVLNALPR